MKLTQHPLLKSFPPLRLLVLTAMMLFVCAQSAFGQWASPSPNPNNNIYYNAGNVGIGTASPTFRKLHVIGGIWIESSASNAIDILPEGSGSYHQISSNYNTGGTFLPINITARAVAGDLYLKTDGNVGIGTTSPARKLTVSGASQADIALISADQGSSAGDGFNLQQSGVDTYLINREAGTMSLWTDSTQRLTILSNGKVGIGTASPGVALDVGGIPIAANNSKTIRIAASTGGNYYGAGLEGGFDGSGSGFTRLHTYHSGIDYTILYGNSSGNVGIGTNNPGSYKLSVYGDTNIAGNLNIVANGASAGNIVAAGMIYAKYQDVAEWVPSSGQLSAGTVVVLDSTKSNQVTSSSVSYDTRVAGVVSAQPGIALGEQSDTKVLVATTGRVKVKVDASKGPIHIGDLLVTSNVPGAAMKSEAVNLGGVQFHRPGTLIGKALEPLEKGKGEILVLLSLQ